MEPDRSDESSRTGVADIEEQISEELDDYFGTEDDVALEEAIPEDGAAAGLREETSGLFEMSAVQIEETVGRIIEKRLAGRMDKMYAEVLRISDEIRSLKEHLMAGGE